MVHDLKSRLLSVSIFMSQLGIFVLLHLVKYDSEFILVNTTTFNISTISLSLAVLNQHNRSKRGVTPTLTVFGGFRQEAFSAIKFKRN